jgi:hypothetical protein
MPRQHFPRDLRITRFVRADQPERRQPPKEKVPAESEQQDWIGDAETFLGS